MGKPKNTTPAPIITGKRETGVVRWFNVEKGFGFIIPEAGGADVFVHMQQLRDSGLTGLRDTESVSYVLERDPRNSSRVLATKIELIETKTEKVEQKRAQRPLVEGVVKWFDAKKGYGFICPDGGSADVFVHITAVKAIGLDTLAPDQRIAFTIKTGRDGRTQAVELRLL